ncbi:hypothetical protein C8Q78DRAFT_1040330 [Trametes maxima]|nr:hypothetical protein C8Q78DRAFT_1040330 [Trametes maxima]
MSDLGYNVWGVVAGVIGTVALVPVIIAWFRTRLPSAKLPRLMSLMREAQQVFLDSINQGLLTKESDLYHFHLNILSTQIRVDEVRDKVHAAKTWKGDVKNWKKGLSGTIVVLCDELDDICAKLARVQSRERKRLAAEGYSAKLAAAHGALPNHLIRYTQFTHPVLPSFPLSSPPQYTISRQDGMAPNTSLLPSEVPIDGPLAPDVPSTAPLPATNLSQPSYLAEPPCSCRCGGSMNHISDADLQSLLSLALAPPRTPAKRGKRERTLRREVLLRFGRQLSVSDSASGGRGVASSMQHGKRPRLKTSRYPMCDGDGSCCMDYSALAHDVGGDYVYPDEWVDD